MEKFSTDEYYAFRGFISETLYIIKLINVDENGVPRFSVLYTRDRFSIRLIKWSFNKTYTFEELGVVDDNKIYKVNKIDLFKHISKGTD